MRRCLILATLETKAEEVDYLQASLDALSVPTELVDLSLGSNGATWDGERKTARIQSVAADVAAMLTARGTSDLGAMLAIGGGTGGDIVLRVLAQMPEELPKVLVSPLPFDPRSALAQMPVILIPSTADIEGLNPTIRTVFDNAASMISGLCARTEAEPNENKITGRTIGLSALSATGGAAKNLIGGLRTRGEEVTVFHANGFGGAGFARFAARSDFRAVIDMTCHEMTRLLFEGDHTSMPDRFTAAGHLPRVVLPGGMNFLGLGPLDGLSEEHQNRPVFQHSGLFTHVKLSKDQMAEAAGTLAEALNQAKAPTCVIVPMGGFSHRDCPGGELEDPALRETCLETLTKAARNFDVEALPHHINDRETADAVIARLYAMIED
ncbi:MAG: Tm-1-like ATP-binding domain-containing protein [Pseudomonadota bacterium]